MIDTVIHSDCLAALRAMPDNSVDAVVTDPPAGIAFMGKEWDNFNSGDISQKQSPGRQELQERRDNHEGWSPTYFTGRGQTVTQSAKARDAFIAFLREVMTEALRVLKPGGHALVWALPRTSHWTAMALEDAGWEVRDAIFHHFGSGFPKSLNVSAAIDKHLKAERKVIGSKRITGCTPDRVNFGANDRSNGQGMGFRPGDIDITEPATPEARQYAGFGTSLKPSTEIWWLVRKPLAEPSIAANVLAYGTGAINVDACRVQTSAQDAKAMERCNTPGSGRLHPRERMYSGPANGTGKLDTTQGRFPSHLLLSHSLFCTPQGTKRVKGNVRGNVDGSAKASHPVYGEYEHHGYVRDHADSEGMEEVEAWLCDASCPIAALDAQSGIRHPAGVYTRRKDVGTGLYEGHIGIKKAGTVEATSTDTGGASRYFQSFPPSLDAPSVDAPDFVPFTYQAKASRRERNLGCEDLPPKFTATMNDGIGKREHNENEPNAWNGNNHPTVKPIKLMQWLVRLITPPGGIVLDPFCGSGSTLVSCVYEGVHFIGIEQDESYVNIARARIAHAREHPPQGVKVPTKKVKGTHHSGKPGSGKVSMFGMQMTGETTCYTDQDGLEEVEAWDCDESCPIKIMNDQTGIHKRGQKKAIHHDGHNGMFALPSGKPHESEEGYPSRYFQHFPPDSLFAEEEASA